MGTSQPVLTVRLRYSQFRGFFNAISEIGLSAVGVNQGIDATSF